MNHKPVVAHIHHTFFEKSETFIYHYISNLKHFHPICLALKFINLEQFLFHKEDLYEILDRQYLLKWLYKFKRLYHKLSYKLLEAFLSSEEKFIKNRSAKLIHVHYGPNGYYVLRLTEWLKIPLVTTFYGYDISTFAKMERWIERYKILFQKGALFLVEGQYMKLRLMELGCPEQKIQIQRIAIPLDRISFLSRKPKKSNEKVVIISAGRFVEKKGFVYALQAVEKLREKYKNFEFHIIGDGPLKLIIKEIVKKKVMHKYVKILGFLDYESYLKEMKNGDIFIQPSVTASNGDSEGGAPATILEAQAMGMPVISTYHADIPNIVVPGESALLSNERDWKALYRNIVYLLENQYIWERMGRIGREFVQTYHDINKEVDALENIYESFLRS